MTISPAPVPTQSPNGDGAHAIEITSVDLMPSARQQLKGFHLDAPASGSVVDVYALPLDGWAVGAESPVTTIEIVTSTSLVTTVPLNIQRPDVAAALGPAEGAETCGFSTRIDA